MGIYNEYSGVIPAYRFSMGENVTRAYSVKRGAYEASGAGLFPACASSSMPGGSLGRVPSGVYSGVFWGNGCNYRNVTDGNT